MLPVLEVSQTPGLAGQLDTRNGVERRKEASSMKATVRNMKRQITALQDTNVKLHKRCRVAERQAGIVEDTTDELRIIVHDPRTLYAVMARCKVKKLKRADFDPPLILSRVSREVSNVYNITIGQTAKDQQGYQHR